MPRFGRVGRPGLIGTAARTAVVAGTATAVSGNVARRQQRRAMERQAQMEEAYAPPPQPAQVAPAAPVPAPAAEDPLQAKLEQLAQLHRTGVLTDEEFAAAKAKALGI